MRFWVGLYFVLIKKALVIMCRIFAALDQLSFMLLVQACSTILVLSSVLDALIYRHRYLSLTTVEILRSQGGFFYCYMYVSVSVLVCKCQIIMFLCLKIQ